MDRSRYARYYRSILVAATVLVVTGAGSVYVAGRVASVASPTRAPVASGNDEKAWAAQAPHRTLARVGFTLNGSDGEHLARLRLANSGSYFGLSGLIHLVKLDGAGAAAPGAGGQPSGWSALTVLLKDSAARAYYGRPVLVKTLWGLRYDTSWANSQRTAGVDETHRDQCLALLAECGLPLAAPVEYGGVNYTVRDLLTDSTANFSLRQRELWWTALAYCHYAAAERGWANRDGERFNFDQLLTELLARAAAESSCAGTHLLQSLVVLHNCDAQHDLLSPQGKTLLIQKLRVAVAAAVAAQRPEGFWLDDWHGGALGPLRPFAGSDAPMDRVLVSGHILEALLRLPDELAPGPEVYEKAGTWLIATLKTLGPGVKERDLCPVTHAVSAVRGLARR